MKRTQNDSTVSYESSPDLNLGWNYGEIYNKGLLVKFGNLILASNAKIGHVH